MAEALTVLGYAILFVELCIHTVALLRLFGDMVLTETTFVVQTLGVTM